MTSDPTTARPLEQRLEHTLLQVAYGRLPLSLAFTLGTSTVYGIALVPFFPRDGLFGWVAAIQLVGFARLGLWLAWRRAAPDVDASGVWVNRFFVGSVAAAMAWSFGALALRPSAGHVEIAALCVTLLGVAAFAVSSMAAQLASLLAFLVMVLLPISVALMLEDTGIERLVGLLLVTAGVAFGWVGWQSNQVLRRMMRVENELQSAVEQTRAAQHAAEKASVAKSRFLATMSHEVRTPLNGILGLTRVLAESEVTPEQAEYLALVDSSARTLLTLLNDVLDFSKIEAGKMDVEAIPFQLDRWLDETAAPYLVAAREKGLRMQVRTEGRLPPAVIGDPGRLRQVVTNLLSNAIKFTDRGEVELAVIERGAQGSQVRLRFEVSDTGVGISPEKQATVFGAFDQADTSVTRKYGGTGLGLAICERLVRLMGGGIKLVSVLGKGSVFAFELLLALADDETLPLLRRAQVPADAFKGLRVLLADDNAVNELLMRKMLAQMGCDVAVARNGREVVARWEQGGLDLILMDVQMPEVSGLEASQQIRERERGTNRRTPIVALTAHALVGDRERCLEAGMDGYVTKPVETQQLVEAMEAARTGTAVATPQSQAVSPPPSGTPVQTSIDAQKLLQRMGGDKDALQDVAVAMRADLTHRMALLEEALTTRNAELARVETHALKGSLASITAERAAMLVKALETAAQQKAWDLFQRAMPMLRLEARRIDSELADLLPPQ